MVGELIVGHDQVGLPGVGTFVAEMVPASFSDKGFTINPPYRRLSFYPRNLEDSLLIDFYASSNRLPRESAATYITQFLSEMKAVLEERKSITLPGLGRLRATRENTLFFVPEEGLDIFPGGIGLRPVSLKSHVTQPDDPVVIHVPLPVPQPEPVPTQEPQPEPDPMPAPEPSPAEEIPDPVRIEEGTDREDGVAVPAQEPEQSGGGVSADASPDNGSGSTGRKRFRWWIPVVATLGAAAVALAVFLILAHVAPDFIDSILYTPEELRIINY